MRSVEDITALLAQRRGERGALMEGARIISQHYNNAVAIPLPQVDEKEMPAVANLIAQGIDQHSMRIAMLPDTSCPPARPGIQTSEERARKRHRVVNGWFETNYMDLLIRKRARHLVAYAGSPILVRPDPKRRVPVWEVKSPLDTYPAPMTGLLDMCPDDVIFTYIQSYKWLTRRYPMQAAALRQAIKTGSKNQDVADDTPVTLAEYRDDQETVLVVTGSGDRQTGMIRQAEYGIADAKIVWLTTQGRQTWAIELNRTPNLAGVCPVVFPQRISLDHAKGMFDDTVGIFQMQAKLMALEVAATAKAVYPDLYFISDSTGSGQITRVADGLRGLIGEAEGGRFEPIQMQPGFTTTQVLDRLERAMRLNAAMPAEYGAEASSNIRTDRRGQSVFSAGVDYYIDEAQKIFGRSIKEELAIASAIDLAYYKHEKKSYYVNWGKDPGPLDYTPEDVWTETKTILVDYTYAGMDSNAQMVFIGQALGAEVMSKFTAMSQLPQIKDPKREHTRIIGESLEGALLASLDTQASQGALPPADLARIATLYAPGDRSLADVVDQVQKEAQARQASSGPPGTPSGPVDPNSPEAQPGLAQPGAGAEAAVTPAIGGPSQAMQNLKGVLGTLKAGTPLTGAKFNG